MKKVPTDLLLFNKLAWDASSYADVLYVISGTGIYVFLSRRNTAVPTGVCSTVSIFFQIIPFSSSYLGYISTLSMAA